MKGVLLKTCYASWASLLIPCKSMWVPAIASLIPNRDAHVWLWGNQHMTDTQQKQISEQHRIKDNDNTFTFGSSRKQSPNQTHGDPNQSSGPLGLEFVGMLFEVLLWWSIHWWKTTELCVWAGCVRYDLYLSEVRVGDESGRKKCFREKSLESGHWGFPAFVLVYTHTQSIVCITDLPRESKWQIMQVKYHHKTFISYLSSSSLYSRSALGSRLCCSHRYRCEASSLKQLPGKSATALACLGVPYELPDPQTSEWFEPCE